MKYTFDVFLEQLDGNWYEDDPLLQHLISRYAGAAARVAQPALQEWGGVCPGTLRDGLEPLTVEPLASVRHLD